MPGLVYHAACRVKARGDATATLRCTHNLSTQANNQCCQQQHSSMSNAAAHLPAVTSNRSQGSTARALSLSLCAGQLCKQTAPNRQPSSHHMPPGTCHGLLLLAPPPAAAYQLPKDCGLLVLLLLALVVALGKCEKSGTRCDTSSLELLRNQNHSFPAEGPRSPASHTSQAHNTRTHAHKQWLAHTACEQCKHIPAVARPKVRKHVASRKNVTAFW